MLQPAFGAINLEDMDDWEVHVRVAVAAATEAQAEGLAQVPLSTHEIEAGARAVMRSARDATAALMRAGLIAAPRAEGRHEGAL